MDKLAKMSALGDLAQEQWEEDRRVREEDARCVVDAEEVVRAADARPLKRPNARLVSLTARRVRLKRNRLKSKLMA